MRKIGCLALICAFLGGCDSRWTVISGCYQRCGIDYLVRVEAIEMPDTLDQGEFTELTWELEYANQWEEQYKLEPCIWMQLWDLETGTQITDTANWIHSDTELFQPWLVFGDDIFARYDVDFRFHAHERGEFGVVLVTDSVEQDYQRIYIQ